MRGQSAPNLNGGVPAPMVNSPSELLLMSAETPYMGDPEGLMAPSRSQQAVDAAGIPKKKAKKLKKSSTVEKSIENRYLLLCGLKWTVLLKNKKTAI